MSAEPILEPDTDNFETARASAARARGRKARERALDLPERPMRRIRVDELNWSWQTDAACQDSEDDDAPRFTEPTTLEAGADLIETYCAGVRACPVARDCLIFGRLTYASGIWGGQVLVDGYLAPERPTAKGRPTAALEVVSTLEADPNAETTKGAQPTGPTKGARAGGGQRWQPRRRSRAQRRRGPR